MLPLIVAPNPILRQVAKPLDLPPTAEVLALAKGMFQAMEHYRGIGLAAPQVGHSLRLIVVATPGGPLACLNPAIAKTSWRQINIEEGCLSLPGVYGLVRRPRRVLARYTNLNGQEHEDWLEGMIARVYQHEIDHINGILFTDLVKKITAGEELRATYGVN